MKYIALLRGINVGGKNKVSMTDLRQYLESTGFQNVQTYINSGNVILESDQDAISVGKSIEEILIRNFTLDSERIRVLVLSHEQLQQVIGSKPAGFGEQPDVYHSDVIFLMGISSSKAMSVFSPRPGVDTVWPGDGVIYSQRLSAERTKSRLGRIIGTPAYTAMTIRNWNTVIRLSKY